MKKRFLLLAALLSVLLLVGCAKQLTGEPVSLGSPAETVTVTGTLSDGVYTGTAQSGAWSFEGTFTAERLLTGQAEGVPSQAALYGRVEAGIYTGALSSGMPDGEGTFTLPNGAVFTGTFSGGTAVSGNAVELPWTLSFGGSRYTGAYTGALSSAGPDGSGRFDGISAAGLRYSWDGGWSGGAPSGGGTLTDERCVTSVEGRDTAGVYSGEGADGLPNGEGEFTAASADGVPFTYTGEWAAGRMNGKGALVYADENRYDRTGSFTDGYYTPEWVEALCSLGTCEPAFTLTENQLAFLRETPDLWERADHQSFFESEYAALRKRGASLGECFSDDSFRDAPYWLELYSLRVLTARTGLLVPGGPQMTLIFCSDRDYQYPCVVLVPGTVDRLERGKPFHIYAVPLAVSDYINTLGEARECLVLLAGDIYVGL